MGGRAPDPGVLLRVQAIQNFRRQKQALRDVYPSLKCEVNGTTLIVVGEVQPMPLSETYRVRIVYVFGQAPEAHVDEPALKSRDDGCPIPHVYEGPRPCLYLPGTGEWTGKEMIAETVIPWLLLWLFYYELWHATGRWDGGGVHPGDLADLPLPPSSGVAAPEGAFTSSLPAD